MLIFCFVSQFVTGSITERSSFKILIQPCSVINSIKKINLVVGTESGAERTKEWRMPIFIYCSCAEISDLICKLFSSNNVTFPSSKSNNPLLKGL